jgi:hypothetical protein
MPGLHFEKYRVLDAIDSPTRRLRSIGLSKVEGNDMSETNAEGQHPREGAEPLPDEEVGPEDERADYVGPGDDDENAGDDEAENELESEGPIREDPEPLDHSAVAHGFFLMGHALPAFE